MSQLSDVRDACFGLNLQQQGRGFYIALELLAIVRGSVELGHTPLSSEVGPPEILRRSHDAARRLAAGELDKLNDHEIEELGGREIAELLGRLFRSLMVSVPGRREAGLPWQQIYLTPYVGELIHWDAVQRARRGGGAVIEEYSYRGVGAYAHWLLRNDENPGRLGHTRDAFAELVSDAKTPLGTLARSAAARDQARHLQGPLDDAPTTGALNDTRWVESLREGVNRVVTRSLPREKRIEMLLHWVPYVMARHVLRTAELRVGRDDPSPLVVDFTAATGPVRSLARRHYKDAVTTVVDAMDITAQRVGVAQDVPEADRRRKWGPPRSFFTGTLSMIGALNAPVGSQHLTFALPLLEAIVAASIPPRRQIEFSSLCRQFAEDFGVVIDARSAGQSGLLEFANASDFELNEAGMAGQLRSLGVLHDFSDSTRMIAIPDLSTRSR